MSGSKLKSIGTVRDRASFFQNVIENNQTDEVLFSRSRGRNRDSAVSVKNRAKSQGPPVDRISVRKLSFGESIFQKIPSKLETNKIHDNGIYNNGKQAMYQKSQKSVRAAETISKTDEILMKNDKLETVTAEKQTENRLRVSKKSASSRRKTAPPDNSFFFTKKKSSSVKRKKSVKFTEDVVKGEEIVNEAMYKPTLEDLCKIAIANQEVLNQLRTHNSKLRERISNIEGKYLTESWVL